MQNLIISFLDNVSRVITAISVITFLYLGFLWFQGVLPVMLKIGNGLAKGKIAIFARGDNLVSLRSLLLDTGLFREKNFLNISNNGDIGRAENADLYLVFWHDWQNNIDDILKLKKDRFPLIVYAPQNLGFIPREELNKINGTRNTTVANFRGRLLSDIFMSLITRNSNK